VLFDELAAACYPGVTFAAVGEQGTLPERPQPPRIAAPAPPAAQVPEGAFRLLRYTPLFSGPAVERVHELQFQRPAAEVELARADAQRLGVGNGDAVRVSHNGTSVELRAQVSRRLPEGVVRIAREHAGDLEQSVQVVKA
jgi:anaerobic selenocysteine-containing dehydrogenase